ncbi:MAG: ABC transporter ATP-binding protein [Candidatus Omnitrophica bacterium]|nr:ABC transporter ATP-binding protein [Candidatus Omnitrophota bacterium]
MKNLLEVKHLTVQVGQKVLLDDVSFGAPEGKITALVGSSGSGKTTVANSILGLLPAALEITKGEILFEQRNLLSLNKEQMRFLRGGHIAMIFQEPLWAFDPLMTIGQQMDEVLAAHTSQGKSDRRRRVLDVLAKVQLPNPTDMADRYPHQLSGGQRQRAMMAQALVAAPALILADEPTSNLDVTLQAKIMDLFRQFKKEEMSMLLISHDWGMVAHLADEVIILQNGQVVESGSVDLIMNHPRHKYTQSLMEVF